MAQSAADLACRRLGLNAVCQTAEVPLRSYRDYYTAPGGKQ
jgi:hypothetical protein